jgi:hypothetical protein
MSVYTYKYINVISYIKKLIAVIYRDKIKGNDIIY